MLTFPQDEKRSGDGVHVLDCRKTKVLRGLLLWLYKHKHGVHIRKGAGATNPARLFNFCHVSSELYTWAGLYDCGG